jgi:hypothetical protein
MKFAIGFNVEILRRELFSVPMNLVHKKLGPRIARAQLLNGVF